MALANEMVLDLTEALKKAEQMDKHLASWVDLSDKTTRNLKKGLQDAISSLQSQLNNINGNGIGNIGGQATQSIDDVNELLASLRQLSEAYSQLKEHKGSVIDLGDTTKRIKELEDRISAINTMLKEGKNERGRALTPKQQQTLIDERAVLSQQLRIQQQSIEQKIALEEKALNKVTNSLKRHLKERANEEIRAKEIAQKEYYKRQKQYQEQNKKKNQTYEGALAFSGSAKTLNREIQAIKNLEAARNALSKTDANYERKLNELNKRIREHNASINRAREGANQLRNSHSNLMNISEQLTRRLALVFSVSQVTGYVKKLASVRGEFELQQKSLAAIIQNKDKANEIFDKVTKLAVQSPFQLKDLVTYTKQLAAYKIQTDKLYDSTKMLADISAGVGVDMNRLVLAYGQVASANYLRGTELRQFSEAGVNVLGELANYLSEVKQRTVEVDEVFEMVSRRMITFEDVHEVLKRMTQRGGEFYGMQAIQAETLKGQISNLKDSIEIMLNDIGTTHEGKMKGAVALVRELAENWRHVANALISVSVVMVGISIAHFAKQINEGAWALTKLGKGVTFVKENLSNLSTLMKSGAGIFGWVGIIVAAASALWQYNKAVQAANKKYDEMSVRISNQIQQTKELTNKYNDATESIKAHNDEIAKLESEEKTETEEYTKAVKELNSAKKEQSKAINTLKRDFPELFQTLKQNTDGTYDLVEATEKYNQALRTKIMLEQSSKGGWFMDDVQTNAKDALEELVEARIKLNDLLLDVEEKIADKEDEYGNATDETVKKNIKSQIEYLTRYKDKLTSGDFELNYSNILKNAPRELLSSSSNVKNAFDNAFNEMNADWLGSNFDKMKSTIIRGWKDLGKIDTSTNAGKQQVLNFLNSMYDRFGAEDETMRTKLKEKLESILEGADFDLVLDKNGDDVGKGASAWREAVIDELTEAYNTIPKLTDKVTQELMKVTDENGNNVLDGFKIALPTESADYYEYIKEFQLAWDNILDLQERAHGKDQRLFSDEARATIDKTVGAYNEMAGIMGLVKDKTKSADEVYSEQIRVLKELHKSYIDLNDIFGEVTSKEGAVKKIGKAFKEAFNVDIDKFWEGLKDEDSLQLDFTTEEGIVAAFDKLIKSIPDQKKRVQAELAKAEFIMEYRIQAKKDADQQLKDDVQKFFDDYEMKIELDKLGISGDAANALFGIESMDLDELREQLTLKEGEFIGRDMEDEYKKFQDKLTEMEVKAQQERLKKYLQYTRDAISERAKLELGLIKDLGEIEKTFNYKRNELAKEYGLTLEDIEIKEGDSIETKEKKLELQKKLVEVQEEEKAVIDGITKKNKEDLFNLDFEQFKSSETFASVFDDLDKASEVSLENIKKKIEEFIKTAKGLSIEDLAKYLELIKKIDDTLTNKNVDKNPFAAYYDSKKNIKDYKQTYGIKGNVDPTTDIANAEARQQAYQNQIKELEKINTLLFEGADTTKLVNEYNSTYNTKLEVTTSNINSQIQKLKEAKSAENDRIQEAKKVQQALETQLVALTKQKQFISELKSSFNALADASVDVAKTSMELAGLDMDDTTEAFIDLGTSAVDAAFAMAEQIISLQEINAAIQANTVAAQGFGTAMNMAMGIIGIIVIALQLIAKLFSAIVKAHDNSLQEQIERDAEAVELLQKRFEKLEEAIDNAMSFGEYQKEFDEAKRNLEEQIRLTEDMIALEEAKKKTDKDAIKGYKDDIEDYNEQLKEMEEKRIEDMGGFGSQEAIKDAAEGFIDAWADAYNETGDGLDALKGKWDEYINNILKKQMMMKVAGKYIQPLLEEVDKMIDDDGQFSAEELDRIKTMAGESSEQLNAIMKQLAEALGWEGGLGGGSELEGLSESIQGVTEVTAQALEAILNSMRFYVIDNNTQQKRIVEIMESWETPTSPMLSELRNQTNYLSDIYGLLNDVVRGTKSFSVS